jgi:hypothetical protein
MQIVDCSTSTLTLRDQYGNLQRISLDRVQVLEDHVSRDAITLPPPSLVPKRPIALRRTYRLRVSPCRSGRSSALLPPPVAFAAAFFALRSWLQLERRKIA